MSNTAMDIDDGTDTNDPDADAASGSMIVTGAGDVVVTRKPRKPVVYALDTTMIGFKELRQFVENTFFRKLKQFNANVECVILIQGVQSKNGISRMCKISIGNTSYAQAKGDDYMTNFGIAEVRGDSDTRIIKSTIKSTIDNVKTHVAQISPFRLTWTREHSAHRLLTTSIMISDLWSAQCVAIFVSGSPNFGSFLQPACSHFLCETLIYPSSLCSEQRVGFPPSGPNFALSLIP